MFAAACGIIATAVIHFQGVKVAETAAAIVRK
jgi:hypothetical protein